jgi:hypothetical protein
VYDLDTSLTYKFRVRAYNTVGNSDFSNIAIANTSSEVQAPLKYDFGPGTTESGYEKITISTAPYSGDVGFGFTDTGDLDQRDRKEPDPLREDFVFSKGPRTFKVDLTNGNYSVKIIAGDHLPDAPNGPMDVFAEGIKKIDAMSSEGGQFAEQSFTIEISDSQLELYIVHSNDASKLWRINALEISSMTEISDDEPVILSDYELEQNFPNPFNPLTKISYSIPDNGHVKLEIFNIIGQKVAVLVDEVKSAGKYTVSFNGSALNSGVYLYRITAANKTLTRKMMLIK